MNLLLHITSGQAWQAAQSAGAYRAPSLEREGFIHCSEAHTVCKVANAWFRGEQGLVLLCIDPTRVQAGVKYEGPYGGDYYPHIYGALNLDAVVRVVPFLPGIDGTFDLPADAGPRE